VAWAPDEIQQRRSMLVHHALIITEEGARGVASKEEVVDIVEHHFGLLRYEFNVICTNLEPFIIIFSDRAARDLVFARGKVVDGSAELRFHLWDPDRFGELVLLPFHVKLSLEGIPHHAWLQGIAERAVGEQVVIHHVDQTSHRKIDLRFFICWAFCQNTTRIPQVVYLTLSDIFGDPSLDAHLHFSHPRTVNQGHVFKILVHIDTVEDLLFYHHSPDQLRAEGRVQHREFHGLSGSPDGDLQEVVEPPIQHFCRPDQKFRRCPCKDDDEDRSCDRNRIRGHDFLGSVSRWFDNRRSASPSQNYRGWDNRRYRNVPSRRRSTSMSSRSPLPHRTSPPLEERRALFQLWKEKAVSGMATNVCSEGDGGSWLSSDRPSEAIAIVPTDGLFGKCQKEKQSVGQDSQLGMGSEAILIHSNGPRSDQMKHPHQSIMGTTTNSDESFQPTDAIVIRPEPTHLSFFSMSKQRKNAVPETPAQGSQQIIMTEISEGHEPPSLSSP
jgi:hypothetical protein